MFLSRTDTLIGNVLTIAAVMQMENKNNLKPFKNKNIYLFLSKSSRYLELCP